MNVLGKEDTSENRTRKARIKSTWKQYDSICENIHYINFFIYDNKHNCLQSHVNLNKENRNS